MTSKDPLELIPQTTLPKLNLGKVDKILDAPLIKRIFKSQKKDFVLFVSYHQDLRQYLDGIEKQMDKTNQNYQEQIHEYLESINDDVIRFKTKMKEIERKNKVNKKELEKQALREEILREMEAEKKKKQLEEKVGVLKLKPKVSTESPTTGKIPIEAKKEQPQSPTTQEVDTETKPSEPDSLAQPKSQEVNTQTEPDSLDLAQFFKFLKQVVDDDLLVIKNDHGRLTIKDIDLDDDKIRIKVQE